MARSGNGHGARRDRPGDEAADLFGETWREERDLVTVIGLMFLKLVYVSGHMGVSVKTGLRYFEATKVDVPEARKAIAFLKEALTSRPEEVYKKWFLDRKEFKGLMKVFMTPPPIG